MEINKNNKFINILLIFYVISSINFIFYDYSKIVNMIFLLIEILFIFQLCRKKYKIYKCVLLFWIIIISQVIVSLIFSDYFHSIVLSSIQFILLNILTIFILGYLDEDYTDKIMSFFVKYSIILTIYSIVLRTLSSELTMTSWGIKGNKLSLAGINIIQLVYGRPGSYGYSSFTNNPNVFGFICAIGLNVFNSEYYRKQYSQTLIKYFINVLLIIGIISSGSRGAIIIAFVMMYVRFILKTFYNKKEKGYIYIILNFLIMILLVMIVILKPSIITELIMNISDTNGRTEIWNQLIKEAINGKVLIGSGFGSVSNVMVSSKTSSSYSAFNTYLSIFIELGIIGIIFFVGWILLSIKYLIKNIKKASKCTLINSEKDIIVLAFLVSIYVISFVESRIMNSSFLHLIWMTLVIGSIKRYKSYKIINDSIR